MNLASGTVVTVVSPNLPTFVSPPSRSTALTVVPVPGPQGPMGPSGARPELGLRRWHGEGPPDVIVGAAPNDEYLDTLTGDLYYLT